MNKIILDTSYLVGLIDERDNYHNVSLSIENILIQKNAQLLYLDCVINEVINVLIRRAKKRKNSQEINIILENFFNKYPKNYITWVSQNIEDYYDSIIKNIKDYKGTLNFNDCFYY